MNSIHHNFSPTLQHNTKPQHTAYVAHTLHGVYVTFTPSPICDIHIYEWLCVLRHSFVHICTILESLNFYYYKCMRFHICFNYAEEFYLQQQQKNTFNSCFPLPPTGSAFELVAVECFPFVLLTPLSLNGIFSFLLFFCLCQHLQ